MPGFTTRLQAYFFLIITVAIWGFATPVIKATVGHVPPLTFLMIRFWLAGLVTVPMAIYAIHTRKLNTERLKYIFTASTLGHILALILIFVGLEKTTAIEGSLITAFSPLLVIFLGFIYLKEVITKREIEGTLLAFVGTLFIIFGPLPGRIQFIGNILFFAGIFFDALYAVYMKKHLAHDKIVSPLVHIPISFVFAALIFTPLGFIEQYNIYRHNQPLLSENVRECTPNEFDRAIYDDDYTCTEKGCTYLGERYDCHILTASFGESFIQNIRKYSQPPAILGIAYMAFISGILAYTTFNLGLRRIEASEASVFYYLQPLFGIPVAIIFLGEVFRIPFVIGTIIIAIGVYMAERR